MLARQVDLVSELLLPFCDCIDQICFCAFLHISLYLITYQIVTVTVIVKD